MSTSDNFQKESEWLTETRVLEYLGRADTLPHRKEDEDVLVEHIPFHAKSILDLGTGSGRLIKLLKNSKKLNIVEATGLDISCLMIKNTRGIF